jgi:predicted component of type VI protein secretion system
MKAELVPDNGDPPIPITRDVTVVGRREYADVTIDDPSLSKRHCLLVKTDGLLIIRDLITTNGTKVKGQRIRWAALLPDDRISLGDYKLRVYLGPDDVPSPSEVFARRDRKKPPPPIAAVPEAGTRGMAQFPGFAAPSSVDQPLLPRSALGDEPSPPRPQFTFADADDEDDDDSVIDLG